MGMIYGSVCSGIEAATAAWAPLGWKAAWFSEIEPFPCAVLQHHYPEVPNLGDMTKLHEKEAFNDTNIDVLIGGTPCQSFSVAGLRKGMADPRGNLALVFLGLVDRKRPSWVVWENVPGVLSSNGGRDFGAFLGALAELGYGFAYRILDAQYAGVPQRRRRVFVVGYLGDWRPAAAVLFERHSLSGDTPPSRKKGERVAPAVTSGPPFSRTGNERVECEAMVAVETGPGWWNEGDRTGTLRAEGENRPSRPSHIVMAHGQGNAEIRRDGSPSLTCNHEAPIVAFTQNSRDEVRDLRGRQPHNGGNGDGFTVDGPMYTLNTVGVHGVAVALRETADTLTAAYGTKWNGNASADNGSLFAKHGSTVRRLTPTECERLQGFPDGHTNIPWRLWQECQKKGWAYESELLKRGMRLREPTTVDCPDGPRYKALGNSMAVPVIRWLGERIEEVAKCL